MSAAWMAFNKEGIYGTRPWKVFGEGPFITAPREKGAFAGLKDVPKKPYEPADFRFTASKDGTALYAFEMAPPQGDLRIVSLAKEGKLADKPVAAVTLLGSGEKLAWKQEAGALVIKQPAQVPSDYAVAFKIEFAK